MFIKTTADALDMNYTELNKYHATLFIYILYIATLHCLEF